MQQNQGFPAILSFVPSFQLPAPQGSDERSAMTADTPTKRPLGRPKGLPKTGGRKRGTPNKATASRAAADQRMRDFAAQYLASIADNSRAPKALRELAEKALALRRRERG
jgi:hypothetical protein